MKVSLFENDKSTIKDELILGLITLLSAALGIFLLVVKPSIGPISGEFMAKLGIPLVVLAIMYASCLLYRIIWGNAD